MKLHADESFIGMHLESIRPNGWGPPGIISEDIGVLTGNVKHRVILFTFQIGEERDRNHWQYLIATRGKEISRWIQVGGSSQHFSKVKVDNNIVVLSGKAHVTGDAMCCPSASIQVKYIYRNNQLMALANQAYE